MTISKMTTKGQVTVPKSIRDKLHLNAGDQIDFIFNDSGELVLAPVYKQHDSIIGIIKTNKKATIDDMNRAL
ncbi:MAG: AbrB/MazE/SpoVT family DNA-binding domain-containing protein [Lentisphaeria bacterium]|nr:AbrB/MazE/SpoVT family DNA-binding domain-containing protein [Lentisphaeria bacterium]NQZ66592.1 AbrB/MazE/SpoVT family DNA-binding domain-containing protein [Lentisphaeria bacterium]